MSISAPPRGLQSSLTNRQARPFTGLEVSRALENHIMVMITKMSDMANLLSNEIILLTDQAQIDLKDELLKQSRLQKVNTTYPKVGWSIKTRLEQLDDQTYVVNGEIELDLERNLRIPIRFGQTGSGNILKSLEEEKIPSSVPDRDRQSFDLPVEAQFLKPDGTVGTVDLRELKGERKAARTIDVGSGAENRVARQLPTQIDGKITTQEVLMSGGQQGEVIVTPDKMPEITLDDIIATPPEPEMKPLEVPLPLPNTMSKASRPNVRFNRKGR